MWKYHNKGFTPGIPARDLTDEEAEKIGVGKVKAAGYKQVKKKKQKKERPMSWAKE